MPFLDINWLVLIISVRTTLRKLRQFEYYCEVFGAQHIFNCDSGHKLARIPRGRVLDASLQCIGYDYTAYIDYMDLAVRCPQEGH